MGEPSGCSAWKAGLRHGTIGDPIQFDNLIPEVLKHPSHLPIPAFVNRNPNFFPPGSGDDRQGCRSGRAVLQDHPLCQLPHVGGGDRRITNDMVRFRNLKARVHEMVRKVPVIREKQDTGGVPVQASDRIDTITRTDKIHDRRSASLVLHGCDRILRLVQHKVDRVVNPGNLFSINEHLIPGRIDPEQER